MQQPADQHIINSFGESPGSARLTDRAPSSLRPDRPCDTCRRRKIRCVINPSNATSCVMCDFHHQPCTFLEEAAPRKRKAVDPPADRADATARRQPSFVGSPNGSWQHPEATRGDRQSVTDYADLQGESLLKTTLGLQNHRYTKYIGSTGVYDLNLFSFRQFDDHKAESLADTTTFRRVGPNVFFQQFTDATQASHPREVEDLDRIEGIVAPHGEALIKLYFRIVHPSLHKKVYLEKYGRSHREFSPPLLAAVYILALNWWTYSIDLVKESKPDVALLESIAFRAMQDVSHRAKLSTVQAGLLLLQGARCQSPWQLTCSVVGIAQDLGMYIDCSNWRIPAWERGLRKRLAWAVFMQDAWSATVYGRPPHINMANWAVQPVSSSDFPESAADEDDEEGSTEVEKGRTLFSAMIALSQMLAEVLDSMYSLRAQREVNNAHDKTKTVLTQAKSIQLKLRSWHAEMPDCLRPDATRVGKLNSNGYLHLAYFATEITIHRRIISTLSLHDVDPYMVQICRSAAKSRLIAALEFFTRLRSEHFQSFWFFASEHSLALIGIFAALCSATAMSPEESEFFYQQLQEYRWALRVSHKNADFLERACDLLDKAVDGITTRLLKRPPDPVIVQSENYTEVSENEDEDATNNIAQMLGGTTADYYDYDLRVHV